MPCIYSIRVLFHYKTKGIQGVLAHTGNSSTQGNWGRETVKARSPRTAQQDSLINPENDNNNNSESM